MFADDVGLLPDHMFTRMLWHARPAPERFTELAGDLFEVMATGGRVGSETLAWFNGGLFDDSTALPLEKSDIETVLAADLDWSEIYPSILGTLFEHGLDPGKRAQLGAHYTDRDKIMLLFEPVVIRPLLVEWEAENGVQLEAEALGFQRAFPEVGPANVKGIELNPYAAELARVSVWIGEIQWMRRNGFAEARNPILKPLDTIECRDFRRTLAWRSWATRKGGPFDVAGD